MDIKEELKIYISNIENRIELCVQEAKAHGAGTFVFAGIQTEIRVLGRIVKRLKRLVEE